MLHAAYGGSGYFEPDTPEFDYEETLLVYMGQEFKGYLPKEGFEPASSNEKPSLNKVVKEFGIKPIPLVRKSILKRKEFNHEKI